MGMGGAGVAVTRGALATYWNPANLAVSWPAYEDSDVTVLGISLPLTASAGIQGDVVEKIDTIHDNLKSVDLDTMENVFNDGGTHFDTNYPAEFRTLLKTVCEDLPALNKRGDGAVVNAGAELDIQWGRFAFAARSMSWGGVSPTVDLSAANLAFGVDMGDIFSSTGDTPSTAAGIQLASDIASSTGASGAEAGELVYWAEQAGVDVSNATSQDMLTRIARGSSAGTATTDEFISNNETGFRTKGLGIAEIGLSYAQPLLNGRLSLGASIKTLYGTTISQNFTLKTLEDGTDALEEIRDRENDDENLAFGVDVGATFLPVDFLAIGVVGKNLNQPRFDTKSGGDFKLDPQVRGGIAVFPADWVTVACDADLFKNASDVLPGYYSQCAGAGVEFNVWRILFLRTGVSKNLASSEALAFHAGLGLHTGPIHLDLAASASSELSTIELDDDGDEDIEFPERAGLSVMLELLFEF